MTATKTMKYDRLLENLNRDLAETKADVREARDQHQRYKAQTRMSEFERAIRIVERAEEIPAKRVGDDWVAEAVQFGFRSFNGAVPMAPNLEDFATLFPPIHWQEYRVAVTDPLQIATLDAAAEMGLCKRVPLKSMFARRPGGGPDGVWVSPEVYREMAANEMVR